MLTQIAFKSLAQAARLCAVLVGLVLRQVHLFLRELDDVAVVNVLSCHPIYLRLANGDSAMACMSSLYLSRALQPVKINMSESPWLKSRPKSSRND